MYDDYDIEEEKIEEGTEEAYCDICASETENDILNIKEFKNTIVMKLRCRKCGNIREVKRNVKKFIDVPVVFSDGADSIKASVKLPEDEIIAVGEEIIIDGYNSIITGIETIDAKRKNSDITSNIRTLWTRKFEENQFNIKIKKKDRHVFKKISAVVDEEFEIGDIIEVERNPVVITSIKLNDGTIIKKGIVQSRYIKQIFSRAVEKKFNRH